MNSQKLLRFGISFLILAAVIVAGAFAADRYLKQRYQESVTALMALAAPEFSISFEDSKLGYFARSARYKNFLVKRNNQDLFKAAELNLSDISVRGQKLTKMNVEIKGGDIFSPPNYAGNATLLAKTNISFTFSQDPEAQSFRITNYVQELPEKPARITFTEMRLDQLKIENGRPASFGFSLENLGVESGAGQAALKQIDGLGVKFIYGHDIGQGSHTVGDFVLILNNGAEPIKMRELSARTDPTHTPPHASFLEIRGLDMPLLEGLAMKNWQELGYSRLTGNLRLAYEYVEAEQRLVTNISAQADNYFNLDVTAHLGSVTMNELGTDMLRKLMEQASVTLIGADVMFKDQSLVQKIMQKEAEKTGRTKEQVAADWGMALEKELRQGSLAADPAIVDAAEKLKTYFATLGTLNLALRPEQPLPLASLIPAALVDRSRLLKLLGATVNIS